MDQDMLPKHTPRGGAAGKPGMVGTAEPRPGCGSSDISKPSIVEVVSNDDRELLVQALSALLRERSSAFRIATDVASARGRGQPDVKDFGLADILRLHRQLEVRKNPAQGNHAATARPGNNAIDFAMFVR